MVVSLGPESLKVDMPKLVGLSQEQAVSKLTFQHLEIGDIRSEYHPTIPSGEVMDQYPTEGTQVSEGTKVNLQISLGPDPSTIPEPDPEPAEPVGPAAQVVTIPLPVSDGMVRLTVRMDGEPILDAEMDAAMNDSVELTINPPASGVGERVLYVYYDNVLNRKITVEF
jgi:serine/threonine-protein kinase